MRTLLGQRRLAWAALTRGRATIRGSASASGALGRPCAPRASAARDPLRRDVRGAYHLHLLHPQQGRSIKGNGPRDDRQQAEGDEDSAPANAPAAALRLLIWGDGPFAGLGGVAGV